MNEVLYDNNDWSIMNEIDELLDCRWSFNKKKDNVNQR